MSNNVMNLEEVNNMYFDELMALSKEDLKQATVKKLVKALENVADFKDEGEGDNDLFKIIDVLKEKEFTLEELEDLDHLRWWFYDGNGDYYELSKEVFAAIDELVEDNCYKMIDRIAKGEAVAPLSIRFSSTLGTSFVWIGNQFSLPLNRKVLHSLKYVNKFVLES